MIVIGAVLLLAGCQTRSARHIPAENALGPYSAAVRAGDLVFVSGQIGTRGGTFSHEVETALAAVERELRRAGAGLDDLVSVTVYLTDIAQYGAFNEIYAATIPEPWPARAVVEVTALPGGARVELQAIAVHP